MTATAESEMPEWMVHGACKGHGDLFFRDKDAAPADRDEAATAQAKIICATCPVYADCEIYATERVWDLIGVWAGKDGPTRRKIARRVAAGKREHGHCPTCKTKTATVATAHGQLECLECGTRWPPL